MDRDAGALGSGEPCVVGLGKEAGSVGPAPCVNPRAATLGDSGTPAFGLRCSGEPEPVVVGRLKDCFENFTGVGGVALHLSFLF